MHTYIRYISFRFWNVLYSFSNCVDIKHTNRLSNGNNAISILHIDVKFFIIYAPIVAEREQKKKKRYMLFSQINWLNMKYLLLLQKYCNTFKIEWPAPGQNIEINRRTRWRCGNCARNFYFSICMLNANLRYSTTHDRCSRGWEAGNEETERWDGK